MPASTPTASPRWWRHGVDGVRRLPGRVPLRVQLVAVLLLLVVLALGAAGAAAAASLRGYLLERVDGQLQQALHPFVGGPLTRGPDADREDGPRLPSQFYVALLDPTGGVVAVRSNPLRGTASAPALPRLDRERGAGPLRPAVHRRSERRCGAVAGRRRPVLGRLRQRGGGLEPVRRPADRGPTGFSPAGHRRRGRVAARGGGLPHRPPQPAPARRGGAHGDEPRLRQVLGNLVGNALAHTPDGTPVTVRVATRPAEVGEPLWAVLEVVDGGPGLPAADAERVFERFYRADRSRSRRQGGSGLVLSIVAALTAAHGGCVELDTAVGRGATFRVLLPLAPQGRGGEVAAGSPSRPDGRPPAGSALGTDVAAEWTGR